MRTPILDLPVRRHVGRVRSAKDARGGRSKLDESLRRRLGVGHIGAGRPHQQRTRRQLRPAEVALGLARPVGVDHEARAAQAGVGRGVRRREREPARDDRVGAFAHEGPENPRARIEVGAVRPAADRPAAEHPVAERQPVLERPARRPCPAPRAEQRRQLDTLGERLHDLCHVRRDDVGEERDAGAVGGQRHGSGYGTGGCAGSADSRGRRTRSSLVR
jgi:hypothetical protein